jgi:hypothetical protein
MKKLAILLIVATVIATGCKKLPEFTSGNGSSGGGDTPTVVTPTVTTVEATEITETFAMLNGVITNYDANYTYETGFYFGTTETLDSFISADDFGHGTFGTKFAGLTANTTYYYKAYAIISGASHENAGYGDVKSFTTAGGNNLTVTTIAASEITSTSAVLNGQISNFGNDASEYLCVFSWGTETLSNSTNIVECLSDGKFKLKLSGLDANTTYKFQAYAKKAYTNDDWVYGEIMEFTTSSGGSGSAPEGAINGIFTINENGDHVYFSKGNLQYQASTNIWRFAENQWDYIGNKNSSISSTYDGWIDLFGWGTGNNPTNSSTSYSDYGTFNDWGNNPISNGGNAGNTWHTLTNDEWTYVFNTRNRDTDFRYAKATVYNKKGVILLPDDWSSSYYDLINLNNSEADFSGNIISLDDWNTKFEANGAVFLPAAGARNGTTNIFSIGEDGFYWSSTWAGAYYAYDIHYYDGFLGLNPSQYAERYMGLSVRLVCNAGN